VLHLTAGVSYYKAICPPRIDIRNTLPSPALAALLDELYLKGLGEFAHQNGLDLIGKIQFPHGAATPAAGKLGLAPHALVALGGGKDSLVSVETIKRAGLKASVFWVGDSELIASCAARTGLPTLNLKRRIDPKLFELNRLGALNGHIPVTAINSAIALLTALIVNANHIVFSNERSADVGNFTNPQGMEVNHQYSKSFAFERAFADYTTDFVAADLDYFSLLRPLSELAVTQRFARLSNYFDVFSSCNRNFRILSPKPSERWCGECPKCHFVFLALAPHLPKPVLNGIFGRNLLDDARLIPAFEALLEFNAHKPFECVGEGIEARAAFAALSERADWREDVVVDHFQRVVRPTLTGQDLSLAPLLAFSGEHRVPPALLALL
jgi:UDP-N-acetyl-alpha-D-muramoyl-L-alanyl-L-glutamate epimerase